MVSVLALASGGCASRAGSDAAKPQPAAEVAAPKIPVIETLAGTQWLVVELDGAPAPAPLEGWAPLSLEFTADGLGVTGNGGVNRFGGRAKLDEKGVLEFGPLAMTRRAGPSVQMELEHRYTQALSRVMAWRQDGGRVVLSGPGAVKLVVLERVAPAKKS